MFVHSIIKLRHSLPRLKVCPIISIPLEYLIMFAILLLFLTCPHLFIFQSDSLFASFYTTKCIESPACPFIFNLLLVSRDHIIQRSRHTFLLAFRFIVFIFIFFVVSNFFFLRENIFCLIFHAFDFLCGFFVIRYIAICSGHVQSPVCLFLKTYYSQNLSKHIFIRYLNPSNSTD